MTRTTVQTVLGPIPTADLGPTFTHEHIFIAPTGYESDLTLTLDYEGLLLKTIAKVKELRSMGITSMVDPAPMDLGRKVEFVADVAAGSGMQIICATGLYLETGWLAGYPAYYRMKRVDELAQIFIKEITEGIGPRRIKPGVIKCATSEGQITDNERKALIAAARASKSTGVPITTHTQAGTMGPEQLDIFEGEGVDPRNVTIGHCSDSADIAYLLKILKRGAYVGFDRIGFDMFTNDEVRVGVITALVALGYEKQLVLSHDHAECTHGFRLTGRDEPSRRFTYIHQEFLPKMKAAGISEKSIHTMLVENPRRYFEGV